MATSDPLDLLRTAVAESRLPTLVTASGAPANSLLDAESLSFPQPGDDAEAVVIAKGASTRLPRSDAPGEFYNLGQVWLAWLERETRLRDYMAKARQEGVGHVTVVDRPSVADLLQGTVKESVVAAPAEAGSSRAAAATKRKYEVDTADGEFCKRLRAEEVELRNRNTVLQVSGGGKANNFESFVKTVMSDKIRALRKSFDSHGRSAQPAPTQSHDPNRGARKARSSHPIIVISSSPTALITMWNVKRFLEDGVFESSDDARKREAQQGNTRAEDMIPILRKRTGPAGDITTKYYVVDSVEALQKFGQDPWDRVVCVVTTGQAWQFKPYKWMDPKVLFRHVKGVYFQWQNEPTNPTVRDWNVTEMRVDRSKRHTDRQVVTEFWRTIDTKRR